MLSNYSKVLIADDHALMRLALRDVISDLVPAENILETETSDELASIANSENHLELILLDLLMPGKNIFEVIRAITASKPECMIIIISASEKSNHIKEAINLGVKGYIPKSSNMQIIRKALELVLAGGRYIPKEFYNQDEVEDSAKLSETIFIPHGTITESLTDRQIDIFKLLGEGKSNKEIAETMFISVNTVKIHVSAILKNLNIENRAQAGILSRQFLEDSLF